VKPSSKILTGPKTFTVNFQYSDKPGDGESIPVIVGGKGITMEEATKLAIDEAFEEKTDPRPPYATETVDPSLGDVYAWTRDKTISAAKIGAKYSLKGAKAGLRAAVGAAKGVVKRAKYEVDRKKWESILNKCYSNNLVERAAARVSLKKNYPATYSICNFSREKTRRRGVRVKGISQSEFDRRTRKLEKYPKITDTEYNRLLRVTTSEFNREVKALAHIRRR